MIAMLKGDVAQVSSGSVVIMVSGVGYLVYIQASLALSLNRGDKIELFTSLIVREDSMTLYGFNDMRQREIFHLLLSVSGVGPKTAMNIVSSTDAGRFLNEVVNENAVYLSTLPGIGKKSAQRIIIELKEKIMKLYAVQESRQEISIIEDAVAVLASLGYSDVVARKAVSSLKADNVEDLIKQALKELNS